MKKIPWRLLAILLGLLLVEALLPYGRSIDRTVPDQKPSFLLRSAHASSMWDGWWQQTAIPIAFEEMYSSASSLGLEFSPKLTSLQGRRVSMTGFMAPPLKPTLSFFVLAQVPMSICPFCSTDADWPNDIVIVQLDNPVVALPFDQPVKVTGQLEIGSQLDTESGFISLVRIKVATVEKSN
ncbi:MAG: hypothetical protein ACRDBM_00835 [Sporomusa sp.]